MLNEVLDALQGAGGPDAGLGAVKSDAAENADIAVVTEPVSGQDRPAEQVGSSGDESCQPQTEEREAEAEEAESAAASRIGRETGADRTCAGAPRTGPDIAAHLAALRSQAEQIPGFDLREALRDPAFVRLTAPGIGVSVADAWYALHRRELEAARRMADREALARAVSAGTQRPREGGGSGAVLTAADYKHMDRQAQLQLKQRIREAAARGEKLFP